MFLSIDWSSDALYNVQLGSRFLWLPDDSKKIRVQADTLSALCKTQAKTNTGKGSGKQMWVCCRCASLLRAGLKTLKIKIYSLNTLRHAPEDFFGGLGQRLCTGAMECLNVGLGRFGDTKLLSDIFHCSLWRLNSSHELSLMKYCIQNDIKLAQLLRGRDCQSQGCRFDSGKTPLKKRGLESTWIWAI